LLSGEATTGSLWRGFAFNEVVEAMQFLTTHPEALRDVLLFALCGATGQVFIFINIKQFGSLINTIVTITRKFFSIFFSLLYFGHKFNAVQVFGILLVFGGLGIDIWIHSKHPRKHKEEAGGKAVADDKKKD
jgi:UDP-galactose transporter B1